MIFSDGFYQKNSNTNAFEAEGKAPWHVFLYIFYTPFELQILQIWKRIDVTRFYLKFWFVSIEPNMSYCSREKKLTPFNIALLEEWK